MKLKEKISDKEKLEKIVKLGLLIKAMEWYGKAYIYMGQKGQDGYYAEECHFFFYFVA